jgi:acyl-CoA dehydrogenase
MSSDAADGKLVHKLVRDLASRFDLGYWREKREYPWEFVRAFAKAGWLGR